MTKEMEDISGIKGIYNKERGQMRVVSISELDDGFYLAGSTLIPRSALINIRGLNRILPGFEDVLRVQDDTLK